MPIFLDMLDDVRARIYPCIDNAELWMSDTARETASYKAADAEYIRAIKLSENYAPKLNARFNHCVERFAAYAMLLEIMMHRIAVRLPATRRR